MSEGLPGASSGRDTRADPREMDSRYRVLARNFPNGALLLFDHDLRYILADGSGLADVGLRPADLEGRTLYEVFTPALCASLEPHYRLALDGGSASFEVPYAERVYECRTVPVRDTDGRVICGMLMTQDISGLKARYEAERTRALTEANGRLLLEIAERKQIETELRESEARFRSFVEGTDDLVTRVDADGRFTYVSPAALRVLGLPPEEILGRPAFEFVHPEDRETTRQAFTGWVRDHVRKQSYENRQIGAQGQVRNILWTIDLIYAGDNTLKCINSIGRDITEIRRIESELRRAKEAAESANASKSQFLANISHELRTPLNGIIGLTEVLLGTEQPPEQKEFLLDIKHSGEALLDLINDLLDYAKIESGKMETANDPFALVPVIQAVVNTLGVMASRKNISLTCDIAPDVPPLLMGDGARLRQILVNLVGNAVKFTTKGGIQVAVQCSAACLDLATQNADTYSEDIMFSVRDTGIGIASKDLSRIFESFTQLDGSRTRQFGGTGLGLSISKRLVEIMGGAMNVESRPGLGSVFSFTIPFLIPRREALQLKERQTAATQPQGRTLHVLVVDDHHVNRFIARRLLEKKGHSVLEAEDGRAALDLLKDHDFDLILMDILMPDMDGTDALRVLRSDPAFASHANTPVVALTAHTLPGDRQRFLDAGFNAYLSKPVSWDDLSAVIDSLAGKPA